MLLRAAAQAAAPAAAPDREPVETEPPSGDPFAAPPSSLNELLL